MKEGVKMNNEAVGQNIKKFRKRKNMTQKDLAVSICRTESSIRKYEKGLVEIPNSVLEQIAERLEITVKDLLPWEDIPEIRDAVYADNLDWIKIFIEYEFFKYSKEEQNSIKNEIDMYIVEGNKIEDLNLREEYFYNIEVEYTHKLLDHVLEPLKEKNILTFSSMIAEYLYMNSQAQSKIVEYVEDLYGNPTYHDRTIDNFFNDEPKED